MNEQMNTVRERERKGGREEERKGESKMMMLCAVEVEPIFSPVKVVKTQPKSFIAVEIRSSRAVSVSLSDLDFD